MPFNKETETQTWGEFLFALKCDPSGYNGVKSHQAIKRI